MRYIPTTSEERQRMLDVIGVRSLEDLFADVPASVRLHRVLNLRPALSDAGVIAYFRELASANGDADALTCFLGAGAYDHFIPPAVWQLVTRGEFLSAYTPYQAELMQGELQAGYEYQSMVCELLAMDVANASMYDGASAAAEAAVMARDLTQRDRVVVSRALHPEYRQVLATYTKPLGIQVAEAAIEEGRTPADAVKKAVNDRTAAVIVQQPNFFGAIEDVRAIADVAHASGALMVLISADPLAFGVLAPPGECDVDIFAGEGQGIGNPLNFGGPYLGIIATRQSYVRRMPGRLVGATSDVDGNRGYVLTLQTREQHIRREKATSNICTNEALNALAASVYLSLIGKDGARRVAELCLRKAHYLKDRIAAIPGYSIAFGSPTFHEFVVATPAPAATIARRLAKEGFLAGVPLGRFHRGMSHRLLVCVTESRTKDEMDRFADALQHAASKSRARRGTLARAAGA